MASVDLVYDLDLSIVWTYDHLYIIWQPRDLVAHHILLLKYVLFLFYLQKLKYFQLDFPLFK